MSIRSTIPPPGWMIATSSSAAAGGGLAYYVLRPLYQEDDVCWQRVAGPYVSRGGAVNALARMVTYGSDYQRDITSCDITLSGKGDPEAPRITPDGGLLPA